MMIWHLPCPDDAVSIIVYRRLHGHDTRKVAYVPLYTCETVLAPFEKAGYQLKFYELDQDLHSIFDTSVIDEISVLSLCGYYGFCNYDHELC